MFNKKAQTELALAFLLVIIFAFVFAIGLFLEIPLAIFAISYILLSKKFSKGPSFEVTVENQNKLEEVIEALRQAYERQAQ